MKNKQLTYKILTIYACLCLVNAPSIVYAAGQTLNTPDSSHSINVIRKTAEVIDTEIVEIDVITKHVNIKYTFRTISFINGFKQTGKARINGPTNKWISNRLHQVTVYRYTYQTY